MKVVISDPIDEGALEELKKAHDVLYLPKDLMKEIEDADVLIVRSSTRVGEELLGRATKLKMVVRAGTGLDNIDVKTCKERGIEVRAIPQGNVNAVAELTVGLILTLLRKICYADRMMRDGRWVKKECVGGELRGRKVGIIGFGRIGHAVGEKLRLLGCKILIVDPRGSDVDWAEETNLEKCLRESDVVTVHVALTPETRGMIGEGELRIMKKDAILVNTSRGGVLDEEALYNALKEGRIAGAALDVFSEEPYKGKLVELENIVLTPHIGAGTVEAKKMIGKEIVKLLSKELKPYD